MEASNDGQKVEFSDGCRQTSVHYGRERISSYPLGRVRQKKNVTLVAPHAKNESRWSQYMSTLWCGTSSTVRGRKAVQLSHGRE